MARQLALDLTIPPALSRDDFLTTSANRDALAMLDRPAAWPGGRLLLIGGPGSGKSHLARFWAEENGAQILRASSISPGSVDAALPPGGALVVENAHEIAGISEAEDALFHLWNLAGARQVLLLITARMPPRDWGIRLPDLMSRLNSAAQAVLGPPDDALLPAVLVKLFADRQIQVAPDVVDWLTLRMERDLGLARHLVAAIDRKSLADRRPVTRRLAAELLDKLSPVEPSSTITLHSSDKS
ncbi:chromosomal replication initiator DnaA [Paracoccus limosus]|uniref:Chromosomal replication initiator DnaA n=1 Tax=Paracoccus limosus TaxID=913252 RepID=A0A844H785_9RHOB|nr:chromosomal replication initiator DnaA [Paracoccus limosus]MTH35101.1 chromosomal replication initiator DnaA [Paracoccus limosus]